MYLFILLAVITGLFTKLEAKKVLLIGNPHQGKAEVFHKKRTDRDAILQQYFETWWQIIQELKKSDIEVEFCNHKVARKQCWKTPEKYDLYIFQNFPDNAHREIFNEIYSRAFLILFESIAVIPTQFDPIFIEKFAKVFTWHDDFVDNSQVIKLCYPVWRPFEGETPFLQRKPRCMISSNKMFPYPYELYTERKKIIHHYEKTNALDLYGRGWEKENYSTYRGEVPNKIDTLKNYRFTYCLENSYANNDGYITEKIFDAFAADAIPIYKGPRNAHQYIPDNCYIRYDDFNSTEELDQFIDAFTEKEYNDYVLNIKNFLSSEKSKQFSPETFIKTMVSHILTQLNND